MGVCKNVMLTIAICVGILFIAGCSDNNEKVKSNSYARIPKLFADMRKGSVESHFKSIDKEIMQESIRLYEDYLAEYRDLIKKGGKSQENIRQQLVPKAKDTVNKLKNFQEKLKSEEPIVMTDDYLVYGRQYLNRAIERLELDIKQVEENDQKKIMQYRRRVYYLEGRLVPEAKYGYLNAARMLFKHEKNTNININGFRAIKKGHSYESIMHIMRMPGNWLSTIKVPEGEKMVHHQQAIWSDGREFIYVEFVNGRANSWKYYTSRNGFEYKEQ